MLLPLAALGIFSVLLIQVFSTRPFLQHEILGQAFWWTRPQENFWGLLFDSERMDCFPGRFRYVEYLAEAGYWKGAAQGWWPREFYDFSALLGSVVIAALLILYAKRKKIPALPIVFVLAFFLLSTQAYLVTVFHFRKAKILVALYFVLLSLWSETWNEPRRKTYVIALTVLGFLTDPFFIVLSPLLALGLDWKAERSGFPLSKSLSLGLFLGGISFLLLNGVIGPQFSKNAKVFLWGIPGVPVNFFRWENILLFPQLVSDLLTPFATSYGVALGIAVLLFMGLVVYQAFKGSLRKAGLFLALLAMLPVCAFLVEPSQTKGFFAGYYGYPLLALLCLAFFDLLSLPELKKNSVCLGLLALVLLHQFGKPRAFEHWKSTYTETKEIAGKVAADTEQWEEVLSYLKTHSDPYYLVLDRRKDPMMALSSGVYSEVGGERSNLAYLFFPSLLQKEVATGRVVILEKH